MNEKEDEKEVEAVMKGKDGGREDKKFVVLF